MKYSAEKQVFSEFRKLNFDNRVDNKPSNHRQETPTSEELFLRNFDNNALSHQNFDLGPRSTGFCALFSKNNFSDVFQFLL